MLKQMCGLKNIGLVIIGGMIVASITGCTEGSTSNVKQSPEQEEMVASAPIQAPKEASPDRIEAAAASVGSVLVSSSIPYAANTNFNQKVKDECQLDTKLASFVDSYGQSSGVDVVLTDKPLSKKSAGKVLLLEITHVQATGGGAWSGPKSVSVAGKLFENGKQIGDFTGSRYTTGGAWGAYKGTCSLVGRCAKTLGKDIGQWLKNPAPGSHLGDG